MNTELSKQLYESLKTQYEAEIIRTRTTLNIYFTNSVGIGEHPQHLEEMDKLLDKLSSAQDKLDNLLRYFSSTYGE